MQVYDGYTSDGVEISCTIDSEKREAIVEYNGDNYIRFCFNPDFPGDAKTFFEALCYVREIIVDK